MTAANDGPASALVVPTRAQLIIAHLVEGEAFETRRNPVGLAFGPRSRVLWASVNERDMLGLDLALG